MKYVEAAGIKKTIDSLLDCQNQGDKYNNTDLPNNYVNLNTYSAVIYAIEIMERKEGVWAAARKVRQGYF